VKAGKRKPLPAAIPREEVIHDIPEEEKVFGFGLRLISQRLPGLVSSCGGRSSFETADSTD